MSGGTAGRAGTGGRCPADPGAAGMVAAAPATTRRWRHPSAARLWRATYRRGQQGRSLGTAPSQAQVMLSYGTLVAGGGCRSCAGDAEARGNRRGRGRRRGERDEKCVTRPLTQGGGGTALTYPTACARARPGARLARPRGRGMRWLSGRHAAGATCGARDGDSPSSDNDCFGGLHMHGGYFLYWLVTARAKSHQGNLGAGAGFRLSRTKGDDGGRQRRRRHVSRVSMSWRFDRSDVPVLEAHGGCCASG